MVLRDVFLAQNNSGKLTITTSVFFIFEIFDIKNLANASRILAMWVQCTLGKTEFSKTFPNCLAENNKICKEEKNTH